MNGATSIEDIVRRNVATLRSKAQLTQQALADEMLTRGVAWTRETVAQVETTNRRLGFTEAIAVAASLDVPLARLTATGADVVAVGDSEWTTPYLSAAVAGTAGDIFAADSFSSAASRPIPPGPPSRVIDPLEDRGRRAPDSDVDVTGTRRTWTWTSPNLSLPPGPPSNARQSESNGGSGSASHRVTWTPPPSISGRAASRASGSGG